VLTSIQTIAAFAFVLGVLIFVHELGHYMMAKRIGVRVLKFSLGFGPRIVGFQRGDTEYCISAIPLGGYVKMAGENPDDPRSGAADEFLSKNKWQRFQVLIMGPAMNILLAIVVMAVVLFQGAEVPAFEDQPVVVGSVMPGSPAAEAGIQIGDQITGAGGRETSTWKDFFLIVGTRANREVPIAFLRAGREMTVTVTPTPQTRFEIGDIGVMPDVHPQIPSVVPGEPADRAGIKPGDIVLAVDGEPIGFSSQLKQAIEKKPGVPITLSLLRGGERREVSLTPAIEGTDTKIGRIGIAIKDEVKLVEPGPIEALGMSLQRNWEFSGLIFQTVWGLLTREASPRQLMGPLAIMQLSGESAQAGLVPLLALMASISLNLGLLNLLPIPVLDGGHIFIMAIEGLARRDFSSRVKEKMFLAGFVLLMMLMVTVIYNDLTRIRWIEHLMPWR
jgi:regulator of sigma E protease